MSMERLPIPNSSVAISRLGFGCARIFGGREHRHAATLLEAAIRCGVGHFDTAPAYGSENVLGEVLGDTRGITIATKVGIPRRSGEKSAAKRVFGPLYRGTLRPLLGRAPALKSRLLRFAARSIPTTAPIVKRELHRDEVMRELDESLRRLRRTTIDLYLLHEPEAIEVTDELREVFSSLQKDGVIKTFGLAFGSRPNESTSFGTVVQCRFPGAAATFSHRDSARIYHGAIRFGLQNRTQGEPRPNAGRLLAQALAKYPAAAVIFSASSQRQIRQISDDVGKSPAAAD
jgi:aryl-alcohol dehydrogenase-like predicted oxidoreductase